MAIGADRIGAFADRHQWLSTSPDSGFVKIFTAQRRDATGVDVVRGLTLLRIGSDAKESTLENKAELIEVLHDLFDLNLATLPDETVDALWTRLHDAHVAWEAAGRSTHH